MAHVDLHFSVRGSDLPLHHGYELFAAIARIVPSFHGATTSGSFLLLGYLCRQESWH